MSLAQSLGNMQSTYRDCSSLEEMVRADRAGFLELLFSPRFLGDEALFRMLSAASSEEFKYGRQVIMRPAGRLDTDKNPTSANHNIYYETGAYQAMKIVDGEEPNHQLLLIRTKGGILKRLFRWAMPKGTEVRLYQSALVFEGTYVRTTYRPLGVFHELGDGIVIKGRNEHLDDGERCYQRFISKIRELTPEFLAHQRIDPGASVSHQQSSQGFPSYIKSGSEYVDLFTGFAHALTGLAQEAASSYERRTNMLPNEVAALKPQLELMRALAGHPKS